MKRFFLFFSILVLVVLISAGILSKVGAFRIQEGQTNTTNIMQNT